MAYYNLEDLLLFITGQNYADFFEDLFKSYRKEFGDKFGDGTWQEFERSIYARKRREIGLVRRVIFHMRYEY